MLAAAWLACSRLSDVLHCCGMQRGRPPARQRSASLSKLFTRITARCAARPEVNLVKMIAKS